MVQRLRADGADVIICMSHSGVREPQSGPITEGDDVNLARAVPEIDVIVGGHTHTLMRTPVIVNGTPIVQAGCYGQAVGELCRSRPRRAFSCGLQFQIENPPSRLEE
jgi:5'-nucleotidase